MNIDSSPPYEPWRAGHRQPAAARSDPPSRQSPYEPTVNLSNNTKPSLDFTQRLERKLAEYNASHNTFKRWLFEIISWLTSAVCMGAIIGIYVWARNQPTSHAGNFLTYTNVLGKIASAALIVPTSEALGQLKWNWFQKSKAMLDFEIFDKASRGPLGAVLLLYRTKGRSLAALGAVLIVLLLAIDSFFQQVVELPERWIQQSSSSIARVVDYKPEYLPDYYQGYESSQMDNFMYPHVRPFLFSNGTQSVPFGNGTRSDVPLNCPTSSCTWPAYETLGVCSACADATDLLTFKCMYTKVDWTSTHTGPVTPEATPNGTVCGYFYNAGDDGFFLMSGHLTNGTAEPQAPGEALLVRLFPFTSMFDKRPISGGSEKFKHVRNSILDFLVVSSPSVQSVLQHKLPIAQECVLFWCVKTIESVYESGRYSETVVTTYHNSTPGPFPWEGFEVMLNGNETAYYTTYAENITINRNELGHTSTSTISNDVYSVDNVTAFNIMYMFDSNFPSYYTNLGTTGRPTLRYRDFWDGAYLRKLSFNPWMAPNNVTRHLERMATSMTNAMRSSTSMEMLQGSAYNKEIFVSVKWAWLSFPLVLLLFTLVFLVATIRKTSGGGATVVWKTSAIPTLICSLPKEAQNQFATTPTWSSERDAWRKTRIKLLPNMGWRVSGHGDSPRLPSGERAPRG